MLRGSYWLIPESALTEFKNPGRGRLAKPDQPQAGTAFREAEPSVRVVKSVAPKKNGGKKREK